ncbi:MAG: FtsW/RodA/SpoVE family cell cycle protein, partial [Actinomycetota bacterium]
MQAAARRNVELSMLILALVLASGALALVALAESTDEVAVVAPYMGVFGGSYLAAHILMRRVAAQADPFLLPLTVFLNGLGLAGIYRLSEGRLSGIGPLQGMWTVFGIICFVATLLVVRDYRMLARYKYILGFAGVGLLCLPMVPGIGQEINGAQLWVDFGPLQFQPGELAKVCLVIFFAGYLAERKELLAIASRRVLGFHVPDLKHFGPLLVMWVLSLGVMFVEKDLGSSLLFFLIFLTTLYIATARIVYLALGATLFAAGAVIGYRLFEHVQVRVITWLDTFNPKLVNDESYQLAQSIFALSTGGLFGTGLGRGRPGLIPAAQTDFIYSVLGEELGFLGTVAILIAFVLLVARGLRTAVSARDDFGQLLAAGLITTFGIQTFIILAGVTRLLPLTGITLPFMSYGGSSMLSNFILMALLARISHQIVNEP